MRTTSSTQFVQWCAFLREEPNMFHREDYYFAEILAAIYKKMNPKRARRIKAKDFIMKFKSGEEKPLTPEERMRQSKLAWGAMLGISPEKIAVIDAASRDE